MNTHRWTCRAILGTAVLGALICLGAACHLYNLEQDLKPPFAEFVSQVRYIISAEERKTFLELPDADKPQFIEEFWSRRDPDPATEENEFKVQYMGRIARANELFHGEGKSGWLTDRGRIYILFGPPLDRIVNPPGMSGSTNRCAEIWYYGQFPVVFADYNCNGNYQLVTYDLTALREVNLAYMTELNKAQDSAQKTTFTRAKSQLDFTWDVQKKVVAQDRVEGLVVVEIPVADIWFKAVQESLETVLDIQVELKDSEGKTYWESKASIPVKTSEQELKTKMKSSIRKEIPFVFDKDLDRLRKGKNQFWILIKNSTGDESQRKSLAFTL